MKQQPATADDASTLLVADFGAARDAAILISTLEKTTEVTRDFSSHCTLNFTVVQNRKTGGS
jgi:hypothetical protein